VSCWDENTCPTGEETITSQPDGRVTLRALQSHFRDIYISRDAARGAELTFLWFVSEVGEVADALKERDMRQLRVELADVLAWLLSFCNVVGVDLEESVMERYGKGCPKCGLSPCRCT